MNNIEIWGHQRSGNHYLAALVNKNFLHLKDYTVLLGGHNLLEHPIKEKKYLYIHRNFNDVSKSVFVLKERFGLVVDSYDEFLISKYSDMYHKGLKSKVKFNTLIESGISEGTSSFFKNIRMTPFKWHKKHISVSSHAAGKHGNIYLISYDDIKSKFITEMERISAFLGIPIVDLQNVEEKVGYMNIGS